MISSSEIKFVASLQQKKNRLDQKLFIAEGPKVVGELLNSDYCIKRIYGLSSWVQNYTGAKSNSDLQLTEISEKELGRISALTTPNEVIAVCSIPEIQLSVEELSKQLFLVLDDIRDPGNLGTIIRIADWFGIDHIVCSETSVDCYNPKVIQATMGSFLRVKVHYVPLPDFLRDIAKIIPVIGTVLNGKSIYENELPMTGAIVIGNESRGISADLETFLSHRISFPSFPHSSNHRQDAESLNASIATALVCAEFRRGQRAKV